MEQKTFFPLSVSQNTEAVKKKTNFPKRKISWENFKVLLGKNSINEVKKQGIYWRKIFAAYVSELIRFIWKEVWTSIGKMKNGIVKPMFIARSEHVKTVNFTLFKNTKENKEISLFSPVRLAVIQFDSAGENLRRQTYWVDQCCWRAFLQYP